MTEVEDDYKITCKGRLKSFAKSLNKWGTLSLSQSQQGQLTNLEKTDLSSAVLGTYNGILILSNYDE